MRNRLIELIQAKENDFKITCPKYRAKDLLGLDKCGDCQYDLENGECDYVAREADYLLANGVIVPPCKVGDMAYFIYEDEESEEKKILEFRINDVSTRGIFYTDSLIEENCREFEPYSEIGKTVFLSREEAEQALVNYQSSKEDK